MRENPFSKSQETAYVQIVQYHNFRISHLRRPCQSRLNWPIVLKIVHRNTWKTDLAHICTPRRWSLRHSMKLEKWIFKYCLIKWHSFGNIYSGPNYFQNNKIRHTPYDLSFTRGSRTKSIQWLILTVAWRNSIQQLPILKLQTATNQSISIVEIIQLIMWMETFNSVLDWPG